MKQSRSFWSGVDAGCAFVIVTLLARTLAGLPTLPELAQDRLVLLLPGPLFAFVLDHLLYLGKPLLFVSLLLAQVVLGGIVGIVLGRWRRLWDIALVLWLFTGVIVLPLVGQGIFAGSLAVALITLIAFLTYAATFALFAGIPLVAVSTPPQGRRKEAGGHHQTPGLAPQSPPLPGPLPIMGEGKEGTGGHHQTPGQGQPPLPTLLSRLPLPPLRGKRAGVMRGHASGTDSVDRRRLFAGALLAAAAAVLTRRAIGTLPELPPTGGTASGGNPSASGGPLALGTENPTASGAGLPAVVTPPDRFYVVSKNLVDPQVSADKWSVRLDGMVDHPQTLRYGDLLELPAVDTYRTLECISNEVGGDLMSNGQWTGTRLSDLLQHAAVQGAATEVLLTSADGYTSTLSVQQAMDPDTLLAYKLDGQPLPYKHGFPARILATGIYGMKNPKWLTHIQLVGSPHVGFWQQQGWNEQGIVQTMSRIDAPNDGSALRTGTVSIVGVAFAGARGITKVEVSTDSAKTWSEATLVPSLGPNTWTFWQYSWQPSRAMNYTIAVRATDGTGTVQTPRRTDPFPDGATGYHEIKVRVAG